MIDIHCHILPSIDDGAASLTESLMMAREAQKQGIRKIVATPHHQNGKFINTRDQILGIVDYMNGKLRSENIQVEILPGQETRIYGDILEDLEKKEILTLNGNSRYILIDFPENHIPYYTTQLFFDMQIAGYTPIIAQPERNRELFVNPDKLYRLVRNGALIQVKAGSVVGRGGKGIRSFVEQMLRSNLVHFIASDAHNGKKRNYLMREAFQEIKRINGSVYGHQLIENSEAIITGQPIHKHIPERMASKNILGFYSRLPKSK